MKQEIENLRRWCRQEAKRMKRQEDAAIFHESAEAFRALYRGERMAFAAVVHRLDTILATEKTGTTT